MRKCVVLGASGFVGRHLVSQLVESDAWDMVVCADVLPYPIDSLTVRQQSKVQPKHVDVTKMNDLLEVFKGASTVFHLASIVHVSLNRSPLIERVNVLGCANVISACCTSGVRVLVYTSTMDVVLDLVPVHNVNEDIPYSRRPPNDYVRTKVAAEKMILSADGRSNGHSGGLRTCALRPTHVYGEYDAHAVRKVVTERRSGALPMMVGPADDPQVCTEMVYAGNVAAAHIMAGEALERDEHAKARGKAYFLCEGTRMSLWRLFEPYLQCKGLSLPSATVPGFLMYWMCVVIELLHAVVSMVPGLRGRWDPTFHLFVLYFLTSESTFDGARARDFGYDCTHPPVTPKEAQRRTVEWVKQQPW